MAERVVIRYRASSMVRLKHPTDVDAAPNEPLNNTDDGSTCSYRVYDPAKDETIAVAEGIGQSILSVTNPAVFDVGDQVEVEQDDGTFKVGNLTAVTPADGTITTDTALTVAAAISNRVRRLFGASTPVTMSEYGTPKLGTLDWGFKAALASDHECQIQDQEIDIEIAFVGAAGGGKDDQKTILAVIKDVKEDV